MINKSKPLWIKLYILFSAMMVIVLITVTIGFVYFTSKDRLNFSEQSLENLIYSAELNLENYLNFYKKELSKQQLTGDLYEITSNKSNYASIRSYRMDIEEQLKNVYFSDRLFRSIVLFDMDNDISNVGWIADNEEAQRVKNYITDNELSNKWVSISIENKNYLALMGKLSFVGAGYNMYPIGNLLMIIDEEELTKVCFSYKNDFGIEMMSIDEMNNVSLGTIKEYIGKSFDDLFEYKNSYYEDIATNTKYKLFYSNSGVEGWKVVGMISKDSLYGAIVKLIMYVVIISIVCIFLMLIILYFVTKNASRSLQRLATQLGKVGDGTYETMDNNDSTVEIKKLYDIFNKMVEKLNEQINHNFVMQLSVKEAHIKAFESQMNPHFLFNTLQLVQMLSIAGENKKVSDVVSCMGEVLRFNLSNETEVLLDDEVRNIEFYFRILKQRYQEKFEYEIVVPDEIRQYNITKFLLQPLIENSMFHGISKVKRKGKISVFAKIIDNEIVIIVKDNGLGLTPSALESLNKTINSSENEGQGIGLRNVNQRLKLYYGEKYGIKVYSKYDFGTDVLIYIPICHKEIGGDIDV